jgi:hypothetical protein
LFKEALGLMSFLKGRALIFGVGGSYVPGPGFFEIAKISYLEPEMLYLFFLAKTLPSSLKGCLV